MMDDLTAYLNKPCDNRRCDKVATHNQHRESGTKWCNKHTNWNQPARARNG